jgi:putative peptidoglycan binding protein
MISRFGITNLAVFVIVISIATIVFFTTTVSLIVMIVFSSIITTVSSSFLISRRLASLLVSLFSPLASPGGTPGYADDSSYSGNGPVYDSQYWTNLAVSVQSELAQRGYYHGAIDGEIGSGSSQAIRAFQAAQGLPVTGKIDPKLLDALGIKYKTA